jgi:Zn-dependent protease
MLGLDSNFLLYLPGLLIALTVHEFAHGYVSYRFGDPTPKMQGRLSLNPVHHIDPIGFIMMVFFRFGWCKPVQINPYYFKNKRQGMLWVALAGPLANFFFALATALLFGVLSLVLPNSLYFNSIFIQVLFGILLYNINLGLFNLIPIAPLDGSKVLEGLLPPTLAYQYQAWMNRYGMLVLIAVMFTGAYRTIIGPLAGAMLNLMLSIIQAFL